MHKLTKSLFLLGVLGLLSMSAQAADVAVLDWRAALLESEAAKSSMNELREQTRDQVQRAEVLGRELEQLQQKLQQDGAVMSEAERTSTQQSLREKGGEFQQLRAQIQQAQQQKEQAFLQSAKPRLDQAIEEVVSRHDVQILVDRNAVVYAQDNLDLTQEVTEILNSN